MFIFNVANPLTLLLILLATVLMIFLAQELKKSYISAIPLFLYLILLVIHVVQLVTLKPIYADNSKILSFCIAIDFVFVLITFFAYLWIDDMEAKKMGKKSIDKSLDWFWKNI